MDVCCYNWGNYNLNLEEDYKIVNIMKLEL